MNHLFDNDLIAFDAMVSQNSTHQSHQQQQPQPPQITPSTSSSSTKRKRSNANSSANANIATSGNQKGGGKQIRMDPPSKNIEAEVDDGFENLFADVESKETPLASTMSRKLNGGVISVTAPAPRSATHLVKIDIYDINDINGKAANDIWRYSIIRSKVYVDKKENGAIFDTINSITLDLAREMKDTKGSESKFMKN